MVQLNIELDKAAASPVVFITGGARRVGAETARVFHRAGFRVLIHYRDSAVDAELLLTELNDHRSDSARAIKSSLADAAAIEECAQQVMASYGRLDVLINNASSFFPTAWGDINPDNLQTLLHSNLQLPMLMTQALAGELQQQEGAVINLVDIHALRPLANHVVYNAAKAGLISLTQSTALDLAPRVRANAIAPGAILLPEHEGAEYEQHLLEKIPLARMGRPEDIARTALFLATSPYITGQVLAVDGGRSLKQ